VYHGRTSSYSAMMMTTVGKKLTRKQDECRDMSRHYCGTVLKVECGSLCRQLPIDHSEDLVPIYIHICTYIGHTQIDLNIVLCK
jgi:hypothetical protein